MIEKINSGNEEVLGITEKAIEALNSLKLKHDLGSDVFIRITSKGKSKEGLNFSLQFTNQVTGSDSVYEISGIKFLIDGKTFFYFNEYEVDFVKKGEKGVFIFRKKENSDSG